MGKQLLPRNDTRRIYLMITWILIHGTAATHVRKRAVPVYGNQVSDKGNNSAAAIDEWRKYWKEKNGGLCDPGHVPHRNNTVCCLVTICGPGYEIEECNRTGSNDSCKKCDDGYLQMHNVSSLDMENAKCFKKVYNHDECPLDDIRPARKELIPPFRYPCECKFEECWKPDDVGGCDLQLSCNSNEQMNRTSGKCERCPLYTYKNKTGCEPCTFNVTLLQIGPDEHYARVIETSTTVSTVTQTSTSDHVEKLMSTSAPSGLDLGAVVGVVVAVAVLILAMIIGVIVYLCKKHINSSSSPTSPTRETAPLMNNQLTEITTPTHNGFQFFTGQIGNIDPGFQNGVHMNGLYGLPNGLQHMIGHANGLPNGLHHMNGHANGLPNGSQHMNGHANGLPNGSQHMNGHANGLPNGSQHMNGHANGLPNPNGLQYNGFQNGFTPPQLEELKEVGSGETGDILVRPRSECRENAGQENDLNQEINNKEHLKLLQAKQSKALSLPPERNIRHNENSNVESTKHLNLLENDIDGAIGHTAVNTSCKTCGTVNTELSVDRTDINVEEDKFNGEPKQSQISKKKWSGNTTVSFHNNKFNNCKFVLNSSRKKREVLQVCREGSGSFECSVEDRSESLEVARTMDNGRVAGRSIESSSGFEEEDRVNVPACRPELSRNCNDGPPPQLPDKPCGFSKPKKKPVGKVAPMTRQQFDDTETHVSGHPSGGWNNDSTQPSSSLSYAIAHHPDNAHSSSRALDITNFEDFSSFQSEHVSDSQPNGSDSSSYYISSRDDQCVPPPDGSLTRRKLAGDHVETGIILPNRIDTGPGITPARVANVRPEMEELKVVSLPSRDSSTCLKQMENDSIEESSFEIESEEVQRVRDSVETDRDCNGKSQQQLGPTCGDKEQEESFELDLHAGETSDLDTEETDRNMSMMHNEDNSGADNSHTAESTENNSDGEESFELGSSSVRGLNDVKHYSEEFD